MSADRELNAIEAKAADWMVERDRGLSRERELELARWLAFAARHAAVSNALADTWALMGEARPIALGPEKRPSIARRRRTPWLPLTLAAAATIAVAWVGASRFVGINRGEFSPFAIASN